MIRIIAVYLPHAGYESSYFQITFDDLERLVMEAYGKQFKIIVIIDFNPSLNDGVCDRVLQDLCSEFFLDLVNGNEFEDDPNAWTWRSRRLYYILYSKSV